MMALFLDNIRRRWREWTDDRTTWQQWLGVWGIQ